jgi:hypothetical protein
MQLGHLQAPERHEAVTKRSKIDGSFIIYHFATCFFQSPLAFETDCAWRTSSSLGPSLASSVSSVSSSADTSLPLATLALYGLKLIGHPWLAPFPFRRQGSFDVALH